VLFFVRGGRLVNLKTDARLEKKEAAWVGEEEHR